MARDPDALMWERRKCPGCETPISVPRGLPDEATRLCLPCQSWQRTERARVKEGLAPAIENSLGQDTERDRIALLVFNLLEADSAPESFYPDPKSKPPAPPQPEQPYDEMYGYSG